ncbi:MAG: hypothetical protein CFH39_00057 [Alphaproteobacteria bacterium MarineAlpha10_Bin2]|nr:MAG: hypothetical protein CFH39_00057 [Alphaproteobacteria bacterium MarineAlpha10_Bin2]
MKKNSPTSCGTPSTRPNKEVGSDTAAPNSRDRLTQLKSALKKTGLVILAAFHTVPDENIPLPGAKGSSATIVLAGNGGGSMWQYFVSSRPDGVHPLDKWSTEIFQTLATRFGAHAVLPHEGPPYFPFQRWALNSGQAHTSPIGILIHPEYGLWHSYRGALIFPQRLILPPARETASPCSSCEGRPCLSNCPVEAFRPEFYNLKRCVAHIHEPEGRDCRMTGCRARRACPVGREHVYAPAQAEFHMAAFMEKHSKN